MGIVERVGPTLIKFSFGLERFFPQFVKFFLSRKLKEYKERGAIIDYRVKARRKGRYHYSFEVDLFLNISTGGETSD